MSDLTELPDWIWPLLDAIADYEDSHPLLYRLGDTAAGDVQYERTECFGPS